MGEAVREGKRMACTEARVWGEHRSLRDRGRSQAKKSKSRMDKGKMPIVEDKLLDA